MDIVQGSVAAVVGVGSLAVETGSAVSEARDRKKDLKHQQATREDDLHHKKFLREDSHNMERERHNAIMEIRRLEKVRLEFEIRQQQQREMGENKFLTKEEKDKNDELEQENEENKRKVQRLTIKIKKINSSIGDGIPRQIAREQTTQQASAVLESSDRLETRLSHSTISCNALAPRLCHISHWPDFQGYGFILYTDKPKSGEFIGKIDKDSPAECAGLKEGDRIVEVNGVNVEKENHKQIVSRINDISVGTKLLVVDSKTDQYYRTNKIVVRGNQSNVIHKSSGYRSPWSQKKSDCKIDLQNLKEKNEELTKDRKDDLPHQKIVREDSQIMERERHEALMKKEALEYEALKRKEALEYEALKRKEDLKYEIMQLEYDMKLMEQKRKEAECQIQVRREKERNQLLTKEEKDENDKLDQENEDNTRKWMALTDKLKEKKEEMKKANGGTRKTSEGNNKKVFNHKTEFCELEQQESTQANGGTRQKSGGNYKKGRPISKGDGSKTDGTDSKIRRKSTTETIEKITYTKDGKKYEDEIVTTVFETDEGTQTTKKTTTRELGTEDSSDSSKEDKKSSHKGRKSKQCHQSSSPSSDCDNENISRKKSHGSKTSSPSSSSSQESCDDNYESSDDEDFVEAIHSQINDKRRKHCVEILQINQEMCQDAKERAIKMAKDEEMSHRPDNKYGENIFSITSNRKNFKVEANTVIDKWYGESKDHKFGKEPEGTTLKTGHFTKMIWKDSKEMGAGKARSASGLKVFIVVNFHPKGNWIGEFSKQVPPVGGFPKKNDESSSSSDSSSDEEDFIDDCIESHNNYREKHGVQPLKKSTKLNKHAKEWAETLAENDKMEQQPDNEYGENIYCVWSSNPRHKIKGNEAVDSWYSEMKDYVFGEEPKDLKQGHFTQIVWEDSKKIGVGRARSKSGKIYVVTNYSPSGNYRGEFASKVHNIV